MTGLNQIAADDKRLRAIDARRLATRRRIESAPRCPICGGRVLGGRCAGDGGMLTCGLYFPKREKGQP